MNNKAIIFMGLLLLVGGPLGGESIQAQTEGGTSSVWKGPSVHRHVFESLRKGSDFDASDESLKNKEQDQRENLQKEGTNPRDIDKAQEEVQRGDRANRMAWRLERKAIAAYDAVTNWQEVPAPTSSAVRNLDDIGNTYTAANLDPLDYLDMTIGDWTLRTLFDESNAKDLIVSRHVSGDFVTYDMKGLRITTYEGVSEDRLLDNQLRGQGAHYFYVPDSITHIHVEDSDLRTIRDIGVGNLRGEVVFAYGSPNMMYRNNKTGELILVYKGANEQALLEGNQNLYYIVFTLKQDKVVAMDWVDGQVWPTFHTPSNDWYHFEPGRMIDEDFVVRGLRLNDTFVNDGNQTWISQGNVFGSAFVAYKDYGVSTDMNHKVNRVFLNRDMATRRGIAVGDTSYLMLFVYGQPSRVVQGFQGVSTTKVYEYKHPLLPNQYLLFFVDGKTRFIRNIMLSDRSSRELP